VVISSDLSQIYLILGVFSSWRFDRW